MVFSYYGRLTGTQKRIYRLSDRSSSIPLPEIFSLGFLVEAVAGTLESEDRRRVETACQRLASALTAALGVRPVRVQVRTARPARAWGELHGLYTPGAFARPAVIVIWMRTARRRQVVAFRTFLRTLVHELCHHLDYELLGLPESFHTEGFYKRESSLVHQLLGKSEVRGPRSKVNGGKGPMAGD